MRKIPYLISFLAVALTFCLSFIAFEVPEWVFTDRPGIVDVSNVRWGLYQLCERTIIRDNNGTNIRSEYKCRDFPSNKYTDCEREVDNFCVLWGSAGYASQLSLVFGAAALLALILITTGFGTHARRRTAWQGITFMIGLHAALQIVTMAIIVHLHRKSRFSIFRDAELSSSFYLSTVSWVFDVGIVAGLVYTAFAAKAGKRWAAGRRAYEPIPG